MKKSSRVKGRLDPFTFMTRLCGQSYVAHSRCYDPNYRNKALAASHICVGAPNMLWSDYCFSDRNELA
ncbi:hypothetical protein PITCH_A1830001 [uncultured Desulfobacterium sp.]|uniref:Uncharacterized protein n=1 Tax=uncultured Desulfobacterium sp. TaxID=201089 RepID=A0A445MVC4_9BACT|nr:hypothetical protein PITCH_A1830001 [uncultured Desulfobacterium sp.]